MSRAHRSCPVGAGVMGELGCKPGWPWHSPWSDSWRRTVRSRRYDTRYEMSDERVECCVCVYDYEMSAQGIRDERDDTVEYGRARLEVCV